MTFAYTVTVNDPAHIADDNLLKANIEAALSDWSRYIVGSGVLEFVVEIKNTTRASGGSATTVFVGTDGNRNIFEDGTASELNSGLDPNGTGYDGTITIDPTYLKTLYLYSDPYHPSGLPSNFSDGLSVLQHEIGHALGIQGWRDPNTGTLPATYESPWDKLVSVHSDGTAWFVGNYARETYGGDVPVTTLQNGEQYMHLGNAANQPIVGQDLMNGVSFAFGTTYQISILDRAIMRDLGLTVVGPEDVNIGSHGTSWPVAGIGDFNGDHDSDVLWRNPSTGQVDQWQIKNGHWSQSIDLGATKPANWQLAGTGDFDGNGTADVLWRDISNSKVDEWHMKDGNWAKSIDLGTTKGADWTLAGVGDFNGDGTSDVLWRKVDTAQVDEWQMKSGNWSKSIDLGATKGADWTIAGLGDFNGDGNSDVLWRNVKTSQVDEWQMRNGTWSNSIDLGATKGSDWQIGAIGDFNKDGSADLIWLNNSTGQSEHWIMANGNWSATVDDGFQNTSWKPVGGGDFNHDNASDTLWLDSSTGQVHEQLWMV